jgi:hypothetical protein
MESEGTESKLDAMCKMALCCSVSMTDDFGKERNKKDRSTGFISSKKVNEDGRKQLSWNI